MWILGLAHSHNGAVALIRDGRVVCAVQLERLERIKRFPLGFDGDTPGRGVVRAIHYCLREAGITLSHVDCIAATTPWPLPQPLPWTQANICWVPHHLAHAEYALHYANEESALVLVVDAHGSWEKDREGFGLREQRDPDCIEFEGDTETVSAYRFDAGSMHLVYRMRGARMPPTGWIGGSVGQIWEVASSLCIGPRDQAGKVMGWAAHGTSRLGTALMCLDRDGRIATDPGLLSQCRLPLRDLAASVQDRTTCLLLDLLEWLKRRHPIEALCYSGGVALNVVSNEAIVRSGLFRRVHMNGACEDQGTAIGAALALHHARTGERVVEPVDDCLGRAYGTADIESALARYAVTWKRMSRQHLIEHAAARLAAGEVVGWFQGRSEFGPRALGNRSMLASPLDAAVKERLNGRIKRREPFRPYAAAVPLEHAAACFDLPGESPVMLREGRVTDPRLAAITHANGMARLQTVSESGNPELHALLRAFGAASGVPVLLNTSLNGPGEPIAETPEDAMLVLLRTELDCLFIGDYCVLRD